MTGVEAAKLFQMGEEKGFEYFFNLYYNQLSCYASRMVKGDPHTIEDLIETSFIKIWETRHTFTQHSPRVIKAWLYTTLRRDCIRHINNVRTKRNKLVDFSFNEEDEYDNEGKRTDMPQPIEPRPIDANLIKSEVVRLVEGLPPACRQIIKLLYFDELSVNDIADLLDLSISTIKNQKARGLMLLRNKYGLSKEFVREKLQNRLQAVTNSGLSIMNTSRSFGIDRRTVLKYKKLNAYNLL